MNWPLLWFSVSGLAPLVPTNWPAVLSCDKCPTWVEMRGAHLRGPDSLLPHTPLTGEVPAQIAASSLPTTSPFLSQPKPLPIDGGHRGQPCALRGAPTVPGRPMETPPSPHTQGWQSTLLPSAVCLQSSSCSLRSDGSAPHCEISARAGGPSHLYVLSFPYLPELPASELVVGTCLCWGTGPCHLGSQRCLRAKGKGPLNPVRAGGRPDPEPRTRQT